MSQERNVRSLNGIWDFEFTGERRPELSDTLSCVMPVPGCYDLLEPDCGKRGWAMASCKVRTGNWNHLFIDGAGIAGEIYWDGREIGKILYAYMPISLFFDAGDEGEHRLQIIFDNRHSDQFRPNFDFYGYGGIYGDVTIARVPETHIEEVLIGTEDYRTGKIRVRAAVSGNFSGKAKLIFDGKTAIDAEVKAGGLDTQVNVPDFRLWSTDDPNLHRLTLQVSGDEVTESFGIREFSASGRKLLLNGKPVKLWGVNRHESHPSMGAAMPAAMIAYDLQLLKNNGFNFIRGSHYPQRRSFLELCDRIGIFVWEESLGWGLQAEQILTGNFVETQEDQVERFTRASYNHPCVVIRGFLNENECDNPKLRPVIKRLYDRIRSVDPHVLISFSSNCYERDLCTDLVDVISMNPYPGWYDATYDSISTIENIRPRLEKLSKALSKDKPFLITEIGADGAYGFRDPLKTYWSEEYQAAMMREVFEHVAQADDCSGVTVWHFADTRSFVNGPHIYARARGFNDKGLLDEYRRPKLAWYSLCEFLKSHRK